MRAALEGRRTACDQAVLLDPNAAATLTTTRSGDVDELIDAHGD